MGVRMSWGGSWGGNLSLDQRETGEARVGRLRPPIVRNHEGSFGPSALSGDCLCRRQGRERRGGRGGPVRLLCRACARPGRRRGRRRNLFKMSLRLHLTERRKFDGGSRRRRRALDSDRGRRSRPPCRGADGGGAGRAARRGPRGPRAGAPARAYGRRRVEPFRGGLGPGAGAHRRRRARRRPRCATCRSGWRSGSRRGRARWCGPAGGTVRWRPWRRCSRSRRMSRRRRRRACRFRR